MASSSLAAQYGDSEVPSSHSNRSSTNPIPQQPFYPFQANYHHNRPHNMEYGKMNMYSEQSHSTSEGTWTAAGTEWESKQEPQPTWLIPTNLDMSSGQQNHMTQYTSEILTQRQFTESQTTAKWGQLPWAHTNGGLPPQKDPVKEYSNSNLMNESDELSQGSSTDEEMSKISKETMWQKRNTSKKVRSSSKGVDERRKFTQNKHIRRERSRRHDISSTIESLKDLVPMTPGTKVTKLSILNETVVYIQALRQSITNLESENTTLRTAEATVHSNTRHSSPHNDSKPILMTQFSIQSQWPSGGSNADPHQFNN